jgi:hypothetical protein
VNIGIEKNRRGKGVSIQGDYVCWKGEVKQEQKRPILLYYFYKAE